MVSVVFIIITIIKPLVENLPTTESVYNENWESILNIIPVIVITITVKDDVICEHAVDGPKMGVATKVVSYCLNALTSIDVMI